MTEDRFEQIKVGDRAEIERVVEQADVTAFAELTGDDNPVHTDPAYAARTALKKPVVHGMLTASFISTMIGAKLPGRGSLWYEQNLRFLAPVRIGEKITVAAEVTHKSEAQRIIALNTDVYGQDGRKVVEGKAKVKMIKPETNTVEKKPDDKGAVIVTGASRGIGAAVAKELGAAGFAVTVNYLTDRAGAEATATAIRETGGRAITFSANAADSEALAEMVAATRDQLGPIHGLVNNACPHVTGVPVADLTWPNFQSLIDIQVKAALELTQLILPDLLTAKSGCIVNIASTYADQPPVGLLPYSLAKAALVALTRGLAVELAPKGIRVNAVSPGMTETEFIANASEKARILAAAQTPDRRLGQPEDVAGAVGYLFSDRAGHVIGQNLRIGGGSVMA